MDNEYMDTKHVDKLYEFITKTCEYGGNEQWCVGYIKAFYNTGLIDNDEHYRLLKYISTLYNPFIKTYEHVKS